MKIFSDFSYSAARLRALLQRGSRSLKNRGLWHTLQRAAERYRPIRSNATRLELYTAPVPTSSLQLPQPATPRVSIVIPVYNQLHYSLRCLNSLMHCRDSASFEVIVVDDASSDDTAHKLTQIAGLRYQRNTQNLGFIGSCNAGAQLARGEFLVFLNNDTVVQPGWLDALLATFITHPDTGLAGSKLVYPDGRLQEAGGIVFSDGSAWNVGRFENPYDPRYDFVREVDYCSGAAIAIRRALFDQLDGFDTYYAPAYYEDVDLAMRVRQHGLKVRYQPTSVVVHFEGISSGTDTSQGIKAYQAANQKKFLTRWRETLLHVHPEVHIDPACAAKHWTTRNVLVIDGYTPKPDRDAGSVRMLELIKLLLEEGCSLSFFTENLAHDGPYSHALQQLGVEVWSRPWADNVARWLSKYAGTLDAIIVSRHFVLAPVLPLLRKYAPQAQIVFDTVDLHFLREQREAENAKNPARILSSAQTRKTELKLIENCDVTWVVSPYEKSLLAELVPKAHVEIVSTIHPVYPDTNGMKGRQDLIFVGSYRHSPNVDAAHWLAEEIFPLILRQRPDIRLHLVGGDASDAMRALGQRPGIVFHGHVPDLEALLDQTRVNLAPLRFGAGVKGKINQSLARGLPMVVTSCAAEGMYLSDGENALIADTPEQFAHAVLRLYEELPLWQQLRAGGLENTRQHFSRDAARETLRRLWAA